jgi:hypothetical protein
MKRASLQLISRQAVSLLSYLACVALLGCAAPTSGGGRMQVEVNVYSGRPNLQWDLTSQEAEEFVSQFQALPPYQGTESVNEGLGYRGLIVTKLNERIEGYSEIAISNGVVIAKQNGRSQPFMDPNRRLEKWLLQTGRGRLDEALYEHINQQLH